VGLFSGLASAEAETFISSANSCRRLRGAFTTGSAITFFFMGSVFTISILVVAITAFTGREDCSRTGGDFLGRLETGLSERVLVRGT
jgi:hypothetical protein